MKEEIAIFWFRRDLRLEDNAGLFHALNSGLKVLPIFIFDSNILNRLEDKYDRRVHFINFQLYKIKNQLKEVESDIIVKHGDPKKVWAEVFRDYNVKKIFCNHDYEPYALNRDAYVESIAKSNNSAFLTFKDQCIFEKQEILSNSNSPYTVFTPYSRKWKDKLSDINILPFDTYKHFANFFKISNLKFISINELGFLETDILCNVPDIDLNIIKNYKENRDFPAQEGTTRLSVHLRFGTISIRKCVSLALKTEGTWLNELIWRDFYMNILSNFPHIGQGHAFRKVYDNIKWRDDEESFQKWCDGKTGFPIVDAGMRELNETGFMHNRVRMIVASFLCKDLLIDWRLGEAYFAAKLNDFDFSANNGGWQWAAGSGCDAAPYFRVFNPSSQAEKFDKKQDYIKKWIPEFNSLDYPAPIVDHKMARERALEIYKKGLNEVR